MVSAAAMAAATREPRNAPKGNGLRPFTRSLYTHAHHPGRTTIPFWICAASGRASLTAYRRRNRGPGPYQEQTRGAPRDLFRTRPGRRQSEGQQSRDAPVLVRHPVQAREIRKTKSAASRHRRRSPALAPQRSGAACSNSRPDQCSRRTNQVMPRWGCFLARAVAAPPRTRRAGSPETPPPAAPDYRQCITQMSAASSEAGHQTRSWWC